MQGTGTSTGEPAAALRGGIAWSTHVVDGVGASPAIVVAGTVLLLSELAAFVSAGPLPRSGLDRWFGWLVSRVGLPGELPLACLTMAGLLVWLRLRGEQFRPRLGVVAWLAGEAVLVGLVLSMIARAVRVIGMGEAAAGAALGQTAGSWRAFLHHAPAVGAAAVHEEVLFRLGILGGLVWLASRLRIDSLLLRCGLVLLVSALFAAAHFPLLNPVGPSFEWSGFFCHAGLGVALGAVCLWRGLALAILVHCVYNLLALW